MSTTTKRSSSSDGHHFIAPQKFLLEFLPRRIKKRVFFEMANRVFALYRNQMSGNPVKIGDGCATVTGYKLPQPLVIIRPGRRERGLSPKSGYRFDPRSSGCTSPKSKAQGLKSKNRRLWTSDFRLWTHCGQLLRQEKDEASPFRVCGPGFDDAFILRFAGMKAFLFFSIRRSQTAATKNRLSPALVSQSLTRSAKFSGSF